jgi:hypothetical protein
MDSLLKKEVITPSLGGSTNMLLIYGQSFSSLENGLCWAVPFQYGKWFVISDGQSFSSSENGPDRTIIFVMKCWLWSLIIFPIQRFFVFSRVYTP